MKNSGKIFIFCFFLIFIILSLSFISSDSVNSKSKEISLETTYNGTYNEFIPPERVSIKRTETTETICSKGVCTKTLYSGKAFIDDKTKSYPNYVPIEDSFFNLTNSSYIDYDYEKSNYYDDSYNIYFKSDPTSGQVVKYVVNDTEFNFQPMALNYRNELNMIQQINMIQSVNGYPNINNFIYPNAYGNGLDLTYKAYSDTLKENLVINDSSDLITPESYIINGGNVTLDLDFIISTDNKIFIEGVEWNKKNDIKTRNSVQIKNSNNEIIYTLPKPYATDSNGDSVELEYSFKVSGKSLYIIIKTPYEWLENAVYPVNIDPTIQLQDADTENVADGTVRQVIVGRTYQAKFFVKFNLSSIPDGSVITQSDLNFYINSIGTTWDGTIRLSRISNQTWDESTTASEIESFSILNQSGNYTNLCASSGWCTVDVINQTILDSYVTYRVENPDRTGTSGNTFDSTEDNLNFIGQLSDTVSDYAYIRSKEYADTSLRPYLNITYEQGISIISPVNDEVFSDDVPTFDFNISTSVNMTLCYWSNDTGLSNYTMENVNNTYFYNTTSNFLTDGRYNVTFYCNESDTGTWRTSDTYDFTIDSENISDCRSLTKENRVYNVINDFTVDSTSCLVIQNNNITINGNNHLITGLTDSTSGNEVIRNNGYNFTTIKNLNISGGFDCLDFDDTYNINISNNNFKTGTGSGDQNAIFITNGEDIYINENNLTGSKYNAISLASVNHSIIENNYLDNNTNGIVTDIKHTNLTINNNTANNNALVGISIQNAYSSLIENNTVNDNGNGGIKVYTGSDNLINKNTIYNNTDDQLQIDTSSFNNTFKELITSTSLDSSNDGVVYVHASSNNLFKDFNLDILSVTKSVFADSNSINNTFLNVSYTETETIEANSNILRKWYVDFGVNDTSNNPLDNANLTIYNSSSFIDSNLTDTSGRIPTKNLIEYINNGTKQFQTPYTINVTKTNYLTNSSSLNFTDNYFYQIFLEPTVTVNIDEPQPITYAYNESLELNYTVINYTALDTCLFYVYNSSNSLEIVNTTLTNCQNTTFNISNSGTYTLYVFSNETKGQSDTESVTFAVSLEAPAVVLNYPTNNLIFNYTNIFFNFTATDSDGLGECSLYGNWTGTWHKNYTWYSPTNATMNYTNLTISDTNAVWNVFCNDTGNNGEWALNNFSFIIDTIKPNILINSITTAANSQTIVFNSSMTDANPSTCTYSIYNSTGGVDGLYNNISVSCDNTGGTTATVSDYSTYELIIYGNDSAGNFNQTNKTFITFTSSPSTGRGGGDSQPPSSEVIILKQPTQNITEQNNLSRAIIYAEIRRVCEDKVPCLLNNEQKNELIVTLNSLKITLTMEELDYWLRNYNNNQLEVSKILDSQINEYKLFTGIIQLDKENLIATPRRIDPFPPYIIWFGSENPVFKKTINFNKVLNRSEMLEDSDPEISVNNSQTQATIYLTLTNVTYASKVYSGTASFTSIDRDVTFVDINLRVINLNNIFTILSTLIVLGSFVLIGIFGKQISKTLKLRRIAKNIDQKLDKITKV